MSNLHYSLQLVTNKLMENNKNIFIKNERTCRDSKTEKAHKQNWDGTSATKLF